MGGARKCEELCMGKCEELLEYSYFDCVNECMKMCLANLAGEPA